MITVVYRPLLIIYCCTDHDLLLPAESCIKYIKRKTHLASGILGVPSCAIVVEQSIYPHNIINTERLT